jgi:L-asparagine transporter-like permease
MQYTTFTGVITLVLLMLVILLFFLPTPTVFMVVSGMVPIAILLLAVKVLRAPEEVSPRKDDGPWYDSH